MMNQFIKIENRACRTAGLQDLNHMSSVRNPVHYISGILLCALIFISTGTAYSQTGPDTEESKEGDAAEETAQEAVQEPTAEDQQTADRIYGVWARHVWSRAVEQEMTVPDYRSMVTNYQTDRFGDYSVEKALIRLPGVQAGKGGDINLRGVGRDRYNVTIDGLQMATTGFGTRSHDLSGISAGLFEHLEVISIVRPDMQADALGGTVNLGTMQPVYEEREFTVITGGGAGTSYFSFTGPSTRASVTFRDQLRDDLGLAVTLNHQFDHRGMDLLETDYSVENFGQGPVDVVERVAAGLETDENSRFGGSVQLNYEPTEQSSYYIRGIFHTNDRERIRYVDSWNANGDWIDARTTGEEGEMGAYFHDASLDDVNLEQYHLHGGGKHLLQPVELEYSAGWSYGRNDRAGYLFPFKFDEIDLKVNMDERSRPSMEITNRQILILDDGSIDRNFIIAQNFDRILSEHVDNTFTGDLRVRVPFDFGTVQLGSSAVMSLLDAGYRESSLENQRTLRMERFNMMDQREVEIMGGDYWLPWLVNTHDARSFLESQRPSFSKDEDLEHERSDIRNFDGLEQIYAGFGMITMEFGELSMSGGLRIEHTASRFDGNQAFFNEDGAHEQTEARSESFDYTHLFPNIHLVSHHLGEQFRIGAAYTRTIGRPDFNMTVPFELEHAGRQMRWFGNPDLKPAISDNLDFYIDRYFGTTGRVGINMYYKNLSDLIFESTRRVDGGEFDGWGERTFENSEEGATLYGAAFSWQQNLDFLPGFMSDFSVYANYSRTQSTFEPAERNEEKALVHQSDNVVNASLGYTRGRFVCRLTYHWTDEYPVLYPAFQQTAPSAEEAGWVYRDRFEDGWTDLSATLRFRISDEFRFWADAFNLAGTEQMTYALNRDYYPVSTDYRRGIGFRMGIRYDL